MKKIIASALGLMLVGGVAATSAFAVESQFGGYWRTRFIYDQDMTGDNSDSNYVTDTRTRLYYTAKFSDDLKFVNKFEFNNTWGDAVGGDIGADGTGIWRIKNSYVDFNIGMLNAKIGIQGATISRGFLFADDMSGAVLTADFGSVKVPVLYTTEIDQEARNVTTGDEQLVSVMPAIKINDMVKVTPHATYFKQTGTETDVFWLGADVDLKFDAVSAWFTGIYNGGQVTDNDVSAFLVAAGADAGIVHGQAFYASGDDDAADTDRDDFISPRGSSYYWSEIMGLGMFDNNSSNGSPNDNITNVWAANVGVTLKPMDKLGLNFDVWYAALAEDNAAGDDELGLEFDAKVSYELVENLNADFVFAYLVAGDATGDDDVIESGVQLSLKF